MKLIRTFIFTDKDGNDYTYCIYELNAEESDKNSCKYIVTQGILDENFITNYGVGIIIAGLNVWHYEGVFQTLSDAYNHVLFNSSNWKTIKSIR